MIQKSMTTLNKMKPVTDPRKCPIHNQWMKKGKCDPCRLAERMKQAEYEQQHGSNKPEIKIGKM